MELVIFVLFVILLLYCGFIFSLILGFTKVKTSNATAEPSKKFSIIIPFRNEQNNLPRLLDSIAALDYPIAMFEILFVDDFSTDDSVAVITRWRMANGLFHTTLIENLLLTGSPKKDAINRVMPIVENEWIITTDADCVLAPGFLKSLNAFILANDFEMVAGPVAYEGNWSPLHHFQRMDMLSLQGATISGFGLGKPFMCNGANLAYTKTLFQQLGGFAGSDKIASGDDVFLLQKAVDKVPEMVGYHKSHIAIVQTKPVDNWKALFHQRVRWAAKTKAYNNIFGEDLALVVFLGNLAFAVAVCLIAGGKLGWGIFGLMAVVKILPDTILLFQSNRFFSKGAFFFPLFAALVYPFFVVAVALYALFGRYEWKGRKFRM